MDLKVDAVSETPGQGVEGVVAGTRVKLGSASFCGQTGDEDQGSGCWVAEDAKPAVFLPVANTLRTGTSDVVSGLEQAGVPAMILSGDTERAVADAAAAAGIDTFKARMSPAGKLAYIEDLAAEGCQVLMVGDGINDAPALSAAAVSIAPSSASDIGRTAADIVFTGENLSAVSQAWTTAIKARRVILQNFALAFGYNMIAVPLAIAGHVSPMIAAIAMSASSIAVTLNALRLRRTTL